MTGTVSLSIFSGLPNPVWPLRPDTAQQFQQQILSYPTLPMAFSHADVDATDVLNRPFAGFRGFTLSFEGVGAAPTTFHAFGGLILEDALEDGTSHLRKGDVSFEQRIYATAPDSVKERLGGMTYAELLNSGSEAPIDGLEGPDPGLQCESSTEYEGNTGPWKTHILTNDCYNYATFALNSTGADAAMPGPGRKLSLMRPLTQEALMAGLDHDGLDLLAGHRLPSRCPGNGAHYLVVMLRHHPSRTTVKDFHCVRLDRGGAWSHKDGIGPVRSTDDVGHPIVDLAQARFKWNPILVGIYRAFYAKRGLID